MHTSVAGDAETGWAGWGLLMDTTATDWLGLIGADGLLDVHTLAVNDLEPVLVTCWAIFMNTEIALGTEALFRTFGYLIGDTEAVDNLLSTWASRFLPQHTLAVIQNSLWRTGRWDLGGTAILGRHQVLILADRTRSEDTNTICKVHVGRTDSGLGIDTADAVEGGTLRTTLCVSMSVGGDDNIIDGDFLANFLAS